LPINAGLFLSSRDFDDDFSDDFFFDLSESCANVQVVARVNAKISAVVCRKNLVLIF
jgi:hypothetical protein